MVLWIITSFMATGYHYHFFTRGLTCDPYKSIYYLCVIRLSLAYVLLKASFPINSTLLLVA